MDLYMLLGHGLGYCHTKLQLTELGLVKALMAAAPGEGLHCGNPLQRPARLPPGPTAVALLLGYAWRRLQAGNLRLSCLRCAAPRGQAPWLSLK